MDELMTFEPGQTLTLLPERRESWIPEMVTVKSVEDLGAVMPGVSHRYLITDTNDSVYSGWWFDPNATPVFDINPMDAFDDQR